MSKRKIFVAGHKGMVGSAICRQLEKDRDATILTAVREELDLLSQIEVQGFLERERPDAVILAGSKVGGIYLGEDDIVRLEDVYGRK